MGTETAIFNLTGIDISFWIITGIVLTSACIAAFARHIVHAAFGLFFTLSGMSGYYILLGSDFLAITQVIIYVGGILVLLMFGILLTNKPNEVSPQKSTLSIGIEFITGVLVLEVLIFAISASSFQQNHITQLDSSTRALGRAILGPHLPALEIAGIVLLLGLIGAAYLIRRNEGSTSNKEYK